MYAVREMSRVALGAVGTQEGKGPWRVGGGNQAELGPQSDAVPALGVRIWVSALDQAAGTGPQTMSSA